MVTLTAVKTGSITITADTDTATITPALTDITDTILFVTYTIDSNTSSEFMVESELTNTTTITFNRNTGAGTVTARWYVAEFSAGVLVQHGVDTGKAASNPITVTDVTSLADVFVLSNNEGPGSSYGDDDMYTYIMTDTTTLTTKTRKAPTGAWQIAFQIIKYDDCSVDISDALALTGATADATLGTAIDLDKTFVHVSSRQVDLDALVEPDEGTYRAKMTTTTNLNVTRVGTTLDQTLSYHAVEFTDVERVIHADATLSSSETTQDFTLSDTVDLNSSVVFLSWQTYGGSSAVATDDNYGSAFATAFLVDGNTVRITRAITGSAACNYHYYVIDFAGVTARTLHSTAIPQVTF